MAIKQPKKGMRVELIYPSKRRTGPKSAPTGEWDAAVVNSAVIVDIQRTHRQNYAIVAPDSPAYGQFYISCKELRRIK